MSHIDKENQQPTAKKKNNDTTTTQHAFDNNFLVNRNLFAENDNSIIIHKTSAADILTSSLQMSAKTKFEKSSDIANSTISNNFHLSKNLFITKSYDFDHDDENNEKNEHIDDSNNFQSIYNQHGIEYQDSYDDNNSQIEDSSSSKYQNDCHSEYDDDISCYSNKSSSSHAISIKDLETLRDKAGHAVMLQIVDTLNYGNIDQLLKLKGIGTKRATKIMEARNDTEPTFSSVTDLEKINMTKKSIQNFVTHNIKYFLNLENI